jgi:hypothetical protein
VLFVSIAVPMKKIGGITFRATLVVMDEKGDSVTGSRSILGRRNHLSVFE